MASSPIVAIDVPYELDCEQLGCREAASHRMYWPGAEHAKPICEAHRLKAIAVASACGFALAVEPVEPYGVRLARALEEETRAATLEGRPVRS